MVTMLESWIGAQCPRIEETRESMGQRVTRLRALHPEPVFY